MEKLSNRILLIDDTQDNLNLLSDLIQHAFPGYTTLTASNGINGLALAASADPDVILLDVVMPGMNGFEVCRKLKSDPLTSLIPVVFLTAIKSDREARLHAIEVGAEAFLSRPVDESELIATIRAMQKIKRAASLQQDEKENLTTLVAAQTQALQQTHTATLNLLEDLHAENEARKKNEEALRDSEDKFRYLFDYSVAPKSVTQLSGSLQVNQAFCDMLGYTREEMANLTWQELTHPDDVELNQNAINSLLTGEKETVRLTKRYIHKNGSIVWVDFGTALRRDKDGQPLYLISSFNDITERKQAEEALRLRESYQAAILENQPGLLWLKDADGRFLAVNRAFAISCGKTSPEELVGKTDLEIWPKELAEKYRADDARVIAAKASIFVEEPIIDRGKRTWFETFKTPLLDERGNVIGTTGFSLDITERKQAQALQQAVYQIAAATETAASLDDLYPQIHRSISSVMPAENFYIALYDQAQNLLHFPYFKDPQDDSFVNGVHPDKGTTAYVLRTGKSLLCTRARHAELERQDEVVLLDVPSAIWLGVPLIVEGKTIGAMVVQHYSDPQAYGEREQHMLEFVSAQVAIAIDRKQAEEALKESEKRYRGLFEHSPVSLWEEDFSEVKRHIEKIRQSGVTDFRAFFASHPDELLACVHEIQVLDVNAATLALMQAASKEQLIGNLKQVFNVTPDMDFIEELAQIAGGQTEFTWDGINYTLDGEKLFISLHWSAAPGFEDTLGKVLVSITDITEHKKAEEAIRQLNASLEQRVADRTRELQDAQQKLIQQEKLATLGQLAGGVGHELRNPLGVINSAVYYLKLVQPDADEKIKKYHLMIEQEVNTASRIINDLLDFGRIVTPDRQPVSIPDLMQRVLVRFPAPDPVQVQLKIPARLPQVFADPLHLEQIIGNLTTNACQAMKDCKDGGKLTISASLKKEQVAIAIKDTGTGITPAAMQRLFEPLFTTKLRGIGLGLAVSRKLAEANGGRIEVRSQPGRSSIFTLYLPVKP